MQFWLLGYEFPATLILITPEKMYVITTAKKAKLLEPLQSGKIPLELLIKGKDDSVNEKNCKEVIETIKSSGGKVGVFGKEHPKGPFVEEWKRFYDPAKADESLEEVDVSYGLSTVLSVKDELELVSLLDNFCLRGSTL